MKNNMILMLTNPKRTKTKRRLDGVKNAPRKYHDFAKTSMPGLPLKIKKRPRRRLPSGGRRRCVASYLATAARWRAARVESVRWAMRMTKMMTITRMTMRHRPRLTLDHPSRRNASIPLRHGTKPSPNPASLPTLAAMPRPFTTFPKSSACPKSVWTDRYSSRQRATFHGRHRTIQSTFWMDAWNWNCPTLIIRHRLWVVGTIPLPLNSMRRRNRHDLVSILPRPIMMGTMIYYFTSTPVTSKREGSWS
mmetsp:Transcript_25686/g.55266  ORF Transcript_25686/g.55266 Transcript_25686/m.55266 type:complete len:249 (-) Transcript_25686:731-1477(-)